MSSAANSRTAVFTRSDEGYFCSPRRVIGFEVEVGPVLLDPGGRVVEVVKAPRLKVAIFAPRDEPFTSDVRAIQTRSLTQPKTSIGGRICD